MASTRGLPLGADGDRRAVQRQDAARHLRVERVRLHRREVRRCAAGDEPGLEVGGGASRACPRRSARRPRASATPGPSGARCTLVARPAAAREGADQVGPDRRDPLGEERAPVVGDEVDRLAERGEPRPRASRRTPPWWRSSPPAAALPKPGSASTSTSVRASSARSGSHMRPVSGTPCTRTAGIRTSGDQGAVRRSRLSQSSRTRSASCIQVPGRAVLGRDLGGEQAEDPGRAGHPLPQDHLAAAGRRAPGRAEHRLQLEQRPAAVAALGQARRVVVARGLEVVLEHARVRPRGVLHEERLVVLAAVGGDVLEVDGLQRRPLGRREQLRGDVPAHLRRCGRPRRGGRRAACGARGAPTPRRR